MSQRQMGGESDHNPKDSFAPGWESLLTRHETDVESTEHNAMFI